MSPRHRITCATIVALSASMPGALAAQSQESAYLTVLSTPPGGVGTCLAEPKSPKMDSLRVRARTLAIASRIPGTRREIMVLADSSGRIMRYNEHVERFNGADAGTGDAVIAGLARDGRWHGVWMRNSAVMIGGGRTSNGGLVPPKVAPGARTPPRRLTADEEARVGALAGWMRTRCPW